MRTKNNGSKLGKPGLIMEIIGTGICVFIYKYSNNFISCTKILSN